jgi:anti-anti-sigma regulatory factor
MSGTHTRPEPPPVRVLPARVDLEAPPLLRLTLTATDDRCLLSMAGTLDVTSAVAVETEHEQLVRAGFDEVILDVTDLARVDESGAVALAQLWARLRNNGVFCRVRGLHPVFADSPLELLLFIRNSGPYVHGALRGRVSHRDLDPGPG